MPMKSPRLAVRAIILHENRLLLVNAWPDGRSDLMCAPGGGVEPGEDPEAAARREIREELGLKLEKLESLGVLEEIISGSPHTGYLFTGVTNQHPVPDGREIIEARFFPAHSLPEPLGRVSRDRIEAWRSRGLS